MSVSKKNENRQVKRKLMNRFKNTVHIVLFVFSSGVLSAQTGAPLRRPVSPDQPMWLIHIDTWNYPDPRKIIELVPKDIRPFVVMNIGLSINHDPETSRFSVAEYGYEIAKSWLRTCAENHMWAMVQVSSGAYSQLPDDDLALYEELYRDYPNLIGFNYAEQSWGYGDNDPLATGWDERMDHFTNLLELNDQYGGYLVVSWCGNKWSPNINPIAMLKRKPDFATACTNYTKNFILCEKYTFKTYQSDMESICLGSYLSGFSGQYGIRYDDTGWSDKDGNLNENFTMATYGAPFLEHVMLTGQTVIDGPELIWRYCFREIDAGPASDGYTMRRWETFPQFDNVSVDLFRKVLDGTVRIPDRQEVIDRTKVVIINDVNSGSIDNIFSSPETLFEGLYRMDGDGNYDENMSFFKKTGRYPTIPTVYRLNDEIAGSFQVQVNKTDYSTRWPSVSIKVNEFNNRFQEEYTGDLYAGRNENAWVTYNPFKTGQTASASIPFKYNTCDRMELSYSQYTAGIVKEYADYLTIYLSNFDNMLYAGLKSDTIKIFGSTTEPTFSIEERADNQQSNISKEWSNGVFTLTIDHNGPVDIIVNCSGEATGRLTEYQAANIMVPSSPPIYTGPLQNEAETFDYKKIGGIIKNGYSGDIRNYTGQGYLQFGTNSSAGVRDYITVLDEGTYTLKTKYTVTGGNVSTIDLFVNGSKLTTPVFDQTPALGDWAVDSQMIVLNKGVNIIEYRANAAGVHTIYFDNLVLEGGPDSVGPGINIPPLAYAGVDKTLIDMDDNGTETIILDGSGSIDTDGTIDSYIWSEGVNVIASGENPSVDLTVGVHVITLTVTDNDGATDSSTVIITIYDSTFEFSEIWLEPECGIVGVNWDTIADANASNGYYLMAKPGIQSLNSAPGDEGLIKISFEVVAADDYDIYGRLNCPSYDDDSFWLTMDNGGFNYYNGLVTNGWEWIKFRSYSLTEGEHTLSIGYREDGAKLDKVLITKIADVPSGLGEEAVNCEDDVGTNVPGLIENTDALAQNYPNPFSGSTVIKYSLSKPGHVVLKIYDIRGQEIKTLINKYQAAGEHEIVWQPKGISGGLYFYRLHVNEFTQTRKLILQ